MLFFTELWERYSFYSMMAILSLYMNEALQFDVAHVGRVYGAYTAGVYFLPLFGGLLADRVLGFNRAVIAGGVLMMLGHLVLGVESLPFFYAGLVLLACGSGLLKPNVSTLVGNLYRDRPELRDQGFNIFYMGINLGAFISPLTSRGCGRTTAGDPRSCRRRARWSSRSSYSSCSTATWPTRPSRWRKTPWRRGR